MSDFIEEKNGYLCLNKEEHDRAVVSCMVSLGCTGLLINLWHRFRKLLK